MEMIAFMPAECGPATAEIWCRAHWEALFIVDRDATDAGIGLVAVGAAWRDCFVPGAEASRRRDGRCS